VTDPFPLNLFEYESLALERLAPIARDYYASGAHDEITLRRNREAFERRSIRYRVLNDVSERDASVELLGRRHPAPLLVAPSAFQRLAHPEGELAAVRAAGTLGLTYTLSTLATTSIEDVAAEAALLDGPPPWFQLYVLRDRELTRALVSRSEQAGFEALVLTVDAPLLGRRERDARNTFSLPPGLSAANLPAERIASDGTDSGLFQFFASQVDPSLTWADVEWLRSVTSLPVIVKGVVRADDALLAVEHGAAAVIVSNHGGRQLDTAIASLDALPAIAEAVAGRVPLLLDGGVRRGTDVIKALALGASAVLVGRPVLWALAVDGEAGVRHALKLLLDEIDLALALSGASTPAELTPDLIA
jgi:4-hydroxymandelate oxidase